MHVLDDMEKNELREVARACACANLRKAARVVTQIFDAALAPSGLKSTQFTLLVTACLVGEETVNGLAEKMVMDRTTLSRNLKPLVRAGLLESSPGEDNRTRLIRISAEGKRALGQAYPMWEAAQEEVVGALGSERYEALLGDVSRTTALAVGGASGSPDGNRHGTT
jgi:DNA-binding MarR family transcriptional regulator